jgi:hypothetical protein
VLDESFEVKPEPDLFTWAAWMETANRRLAYDELPGGIEVSTVFLGDDHSFFGGSPILWETLVTYPDRDSEIDRYLSKDEALIGHNDLVAKLRGEQ